MGGVSGYQGVTGRAIRRLGRVIVRAHVLRDIFRNRRDLAFLREIPTAAPDSRHALLPLLTGFIYEAKVQLMLAIALRLRGWRVSVLLPTRSTSWIKLYCEAFGVRDVYYLEDFETNDQGDDLAADTKDLLAGDLDFQKVKTWMYGESWIGPQVLATVSRRTLTGSPDPRDPTIREVIERVLPEVLRNTSRARAVLDRLQPDLCLVNEANYSLYGPLVDVAIARGADVIQVTQPWRDDALMCKRLTKTTRRHHPSSVAKETMQDLATRRWGPQEEETLSEEFDARYSGRWFLQQRNQPGAENLGNAELVGRLALDRNKPTAVVFSHVLWDANLFYGEDLFQDYGDWFAHTVTGAASNDNVNWLIKLHPANIWKRRYENLGDQYTEMTILNETIGTPPPHVKIVPADTKVGTLSLFRFCDYGITVRGTAGMEMACFGKTVLTAGTGRYSGLGFTVDSATAEEYLSKLHNLHTLGPPTPEQTLLAKRHAHAVFRLRHWSMKSFEATFDYPTIGSHPLDHNLHPLARSLEDIIRFGDLDRWADWAIESQSVDYLEYEP